MTRLLPIARHSVGRRGLALALLSLSTTASCNDSETLSSTVPALTTVDLTLESSFVEVGQTTMASASPLDQFAAPISAASVIYYSSNPQVAVASPTTGKIFAIGPGTAQIIATIDQRSGQRTITVSKPPGIKINEVKSNGDAPGGWVELLNPTAFTVDMSGWTLTGSNVLQSVPLPAGTTIPSHGYLLVDEGEFPAGLGAIDAVHVFSRYGVQVDGYAWTSAPATTLGRCPDGTGDFVVTSAATRGATNTCAKTTAR
jgi:hypothetical protein